jgi:23S rRNA pseudouridine1911/1915/1917 synthase
MSITLEASSEDAGKRLDWFLHERLPEYSRARLQSWIKSGLVRMNGSAARASYVLRGREQLEVTPGELPPLKAKAEDLALTVLYEDQDVVVIDKPAGMVVHAGAGHQEGTLVNALLHRFGKLSTVAGDLRPGIVHRLDKDTSGVLVVARTDRAHQALAAQFHSREVEKIYWALVHGHPPDQGTIEKPVARDPVRRTRMTTRLASGRKALTRYNVSKRVGEFSYLEVKIGTGRTHQIRVHLASIRHPIVGDSLYGAPRTINGMPPLQRFFLHAASLAFRSPSDGTWIRVASPLPPELAGWLRVLEAARPPSMRTHNRRSQ